MTFNSYSFIFLFLPIISLLYYFLIHYKKLKTAKGFLLASSLFFYFCAGWQHFILLSFGILINCYLHKLLLKAAYHLKFRKIILFFIVISADTCYNYVSADINFFIGISKLAYFLLT